jgi:hypothetical protein
VPLSAAYVAEGTYPADICVLRYALERNARTCSAVCCFCRIRKLARKPSYSDWLPLQFWKTCRAPESMLSPVPTTISPARISNDRGR